MHAQRCLRLRQKRLHAFILVVKRHGAHAPCRSHLRRRGYAQLGSESLCRSYPAIRGRRASSGRTNLQSKPSNNAANIADDIRITPSAIFGHTNLAALKALVPQHQARSIPDQNLVGTARFDRNTRPRH